MYLSCIYCSFTHTRHTCLVCPGVFVFRALLTILAKAVPVCSIPLRCLDWEMGTSPKGEEVSSLFEGFLCFEAPGA